MTPDVAPIKLMEGVISSALPLLALNELNLASPAPECGLWEGKLPAVTLDHAASVNDVPPVVEDQPEGGKVVPSKLSVNRLIPQEDAVDNNKTESRSSFRMSIFVKVPFRALI
jgi:hypothetical protein